MHNCRERFRVKLKAYSVYSLEGIILPTDLKEDLLKIQLTILESFYEALWSSR